MFYLLSMLFVYFYVFALSKNKNMHMIFFAVLSDFCLVFYRLPFLLSAVAFVAAAAVAILVYFLVDLRIYEKCHVSFAEC